MLSLVFADNPQSYANTLYLFDKKEVRESIWDIKKRIRICIAGDALYYKENVPTLNIVGSGFFDSIGLFRKCNAEQETVTPSGWLQHRTFERPFILDLIIGRTTFGFISESFRIAVVLAR